MRSAPPRSGGRGRREAPPRAREAAAPDDPALTRMLFAALALLFALRVAGALSPSNWLWGVNTLRYWPRPLGVAIALLAAAGFVPAVARRIAGTLDALGAAWERAPGRGDALAALAVAALVFALRDPVEFAGDFGLRVGALATTLDPHVLFPQAYPLDALLHFQLAHALVAAGWSPETALQAIGAAMAALFTLGCLRFVRACGARGAAFVAGALVLIAGGYLTHFAGYEKYGPVLAGLAFAAAGAVRLAREGAHGEWELAAGANAAVLTHRVGFAVVPAVLVAFVLAALRAKEAPRRASVLFAGLTCVLALIALAPFAWHVFTTIDRSVHLPGGEVAKTLGSAGTSDELLRASDTLNALFFLAPLALAGAIAAALLQRSAPARRGRAMLPALAGTAVVGALGLMLFVRASRGSGRDWDASTAPALVVALATTGALVAAWRRGAARTLAPAVTLALAAAATSWALHADTSMNLARIDTLLAATPAWSPTARSFAHDHVGLFALNHARWDEAARQFDAAYALEPNPRYVYQEGLADLKAGRLARAEAEYREAIRRGTRASDPWTGLANLALARRDSAAAFALADSALARNPRDVQAGALARLAHAATP
ncbi:MAG TPA: hypothetical protein VMH61_00420 [Candidatus Acidoferrales bacterium]|nr:hypothetical protein [Candidatus Acidoferrales bacterium]